MRNDRDVIAEAAVSTGATCVDPLADGWLSTGSDLDQIDGVHLTDAGHAAIADRMQAVLGQAPGR